MKRCRICWRCGAYLIDGDGRCSGCHLAPDDLITTARTVVAEDGSIMGFWMNNWKLMAILAIIWIGLALLLDYFGLPPYG